MAASQLDSDTKELILEMLDQGITPRNIAYKIGVHASTVSRVKTKYSSTAKLATRLIRANAEVLAQRIVDRATVDEAIQVLSRPNIDVLKPITKNDGNTGIFISVGAASLGAFANTEEPMGLPPQPAIIDVSPVEPPASAPKKLDATPRTIVGVADNHIRVNKRNKKSAIHLRYDVEGVTE